MYLEYVGKKDLQKAIKVQQQLKQPVDESQVSEQYIRKLIEEGMPEHRKKQKESDVEMQTTDGGAQVYIPKKRNKKVKYPKGYDPANPGQMPDPERWLPKW